MKKVNFKFISLFTICLISFISFAFLNIVEIQQVVADENADTPTYEAESQSQEESAHMPGVYFLINTLETIKDNLPLH